MIGQLRTYFATSKRLLALILALGLIATVFAVGLMFVAGYLISASADNAYSLLMLNIPLAFVQIFGLGKPIARYFERLESHDWVLRLTSSLRRRLFRQAQKQQAESGDLRTGDALAGLASDIEQVQNLFLRTVFPVLIAWLSGILLVVIAGFASPALLGFAFGMLVLLCLVIPLLALALHRKRILDTDEQRAGLYASLTDSILGAQDIAISGRGQEQTEHFARRFAQLGTAEGALERADRIRLVAVQVVLLIAFLVILEWATGRFGGVDGGSANWIIAVALGFFPLIEVFAPLSQQFEDGVSQREALERLSDEGQPAADQASGAARKDPQPPYRIEINDLAFGYEEDIRNPTSGYEGDISDTASNCEDGAPRPLIEGLSLSIPYGERVAILGKSGSGKTTLAHLIHGDVAPSAGSVTLGGVPIADLRDVIWDYIGFISQDSYVFAMSIMDNLRIGKIDCSEEEAWSALEAVDLKAYVESLPDGLESMADEAGLNFSGGQRQRLVLARVLLQNPSVVILDEPTVGLDPATEQTVLDTIDRVFAGRTIIMITHHLQGIDAFDRVIFLEEGRVVMDGTPATLARNNERYRKLLAFDRGLFS